MPAILRARLALKVRDQKLAQTHAEVLEQFGFDVTKVSQRGVGFEGQKELFEKVFQCRIAVSHSGVDVRMELQLPEQLRSQVDSVYFPTKPTFFT